jgi:hypothetical protein
MVPRATQSAWTKWGRWYSTTRWARIRKHQLLEHPLCACCLERARDHLRSRRAAPRRREQVLAWPVPELVRSVSPQCQALGGAARVPPRHRASMPGRLTRTIRPTGRGGSPCGFGQGSLSREARRRDGLDINRQRTVRIQLDVDREVDVPEILSELAGVIRIVRCAMGEALDHQHRHAPTRGRIHRASRPPDLEGED